MTDENARKAILARRARFIAAATLSAGLVSCGEGTSTAPTVCLSVAMPPPTDPPPQPCLSPPPILPDGTGTGATDGGAPSPPDAGSAPQPCLSHRPNPPQPPPPQPCLSPRRPPPPNR